MTGAVGETQVGITCPNRVVNIDPDHIYYQAGVGRRSDHGQVEREIHTLEPNHEPRCIKACIGQAARRGMVGQNPGR